MYAKIQNGSVVKSPYTIDDLKKDNPQTSFPDQVSDALLAEHGVVTVVVTTKPDTDHTKNVAFGTPKFNQDTQQWETVWIVEDASQDEINERVLAETEKVRNERNVLIAATDWLVVKHLELNENIPGKWEVYRQALRDVPAQAGFPFNISWPVKPA
jgi:hypothetical protein